MKLQRLLLNKYSISALILLLLLGTDIMLHKGMTRVMIPSSFEAFPVSGVKTCSHLINPGQKEWIKGVNILEQVNAIEEKSGIETDIYFDSARLEFFVYHDSTKLSDLTLESLLNNQSKVDAVWLDIKNLDENNNAKALQRLNIIRKSIPEISILVESPDAKALKLFCDSGYATIFYSPFFNPYTDEEARLVAATNSMDKLLQMYPASAISGYYFQYPLLKHRFPGYPVVTWSVKHTGSAISYFLNRQLEKDTSVKIILYPQD